MAKTKKSAIKQKKRIMSILRLVLVLLLLLSVLFFAVRSTGQVAFSNAQDGFRNFFAGFSAGSGYPYSVNMASLLQMDTVGSNLILLTEDTVTTLNNTAKVLFEEKHGYSAPAMTLSNGRAVIFDRNSGKFSVLSATEKLYSHDVQANITTASVGKKGNVALAVASDEVQSILHVFNRKLEPVFTFRCAKERITGIALSDNGKSVAIAVLGAKDAQIYSRVLVFDFSAKEAVATFEYPGVTLFYVGFTSAGALQVIGDTVYDNIVEKTQRKEIMTFTQGTLLGYSADKNGMVALLVAPHGNKTETKLLRYNKGGEKTYEVSVGDVKDIAGAGRYVAVLYHDRVVLYNQKGEQYKSETGIETMKSIQLVRKDVYGKGLKDILQYSF